MIKITANMIFPMAVMANTFAMTVLLIALGVSGQSGLAADIGMVHGATLALFFAFSANARSLILSESSPVQAGSMMLARLVLLLPLAAVSYFLSISAGVEAGLAVVLILRRCAEWLGEVHLSELERLDRRREAGLYFASQAVLLVMAFGWFLLGMPYPFVGLWLWAVLPLLVSAGSILNALSADSRAMQGLSVNLIPHFGSSAIIGISVYVFRLLVLFVTGKETAGDLFTAFAIGGVTGSVFANALGASITLHEQRSGKRHFPYLLRLALNVSLAVGACIFIAAAVDLPMFALTGKSFFFWQAVGLSMIGGVVMVYAQRIRFRLLQQDEEHDVFGPDVIMNILLLAAVPFAYYLLGRESMAGLYLLGAVLAYVFYSSSQKEETLNQLSEPAKDNIRIIVAVALLIPIFFQASHGLFRDPSFAFDSGGRLVNLPIPLSVFACYAGIVVLGEYRRAIKAYMTIFLTCIFMVMATVVSSIDNIESEESKLILLLQYILPMFALALGQAYDTGRSDEGGKLLGKVFLSVLAIIVPLHLLSSWYQGFSYLAPSVGLFSIYQHLQYVPVIIVSAYLVALYALWNVLNWRRVLLVLVPVMAIYVAASVSMLAIGFLLIGFLLLGIWHWRGNQAKLPALVLLLVAALSIGYLFFAKDAVVFKFGFLSAPSSDYGVDKAVVAVDTVPPNLKGRIDYWSYYWDQIVESPRLILIGHSEAPDRSRYPSAHNFYLDLIYNFGFLALLPLITLLALTCARIYQNWQNLPLGLVGLCLVVLFLLLVDNSLKVGLRQPYPGIFTYFLWGVLLNRLTVFKFERNAA